MSDRHSISPYPIRMPVDLRERLEKCAREGNRSLHAEIISRLQESCARESDTAPHSLTFAISKEKLAKPAPTEEGQKAGNEVVLSAATIAAFQRVEARMQKRMEEHLKQLKQAAEELARVQDKSTG